MAELRDRIDITVEELEESLGEKNLPKFIAESEKIREAAYSSELPPETCAPWHSVM